MSSAIDALRIFGQAWWERNDEVADMDKFNRRVLLYMGTNSYLSATDAPEKVAEFALKTLVVGGADSTLGAIGEGAATLYGGPVAGWLGGFAGAIVGAAWGEHEYNLRFKHLIQRWFPGKEERAKLEFTGIMETGAKMIGKVLNNPYLSVEEKINKLSTFSKGYGYCAEQFWQVDPLASHATARLKVFSDEHIQKLKEALSHQKEGFQPISLGNADPSPSKKGTPQAKELLSHYGIDFNSLDPKSQFLVAGAANFYTKMIKKIRKEDVYQFGNDLFDLFAFAKDPGVRFAGKVGKHAVHLIQDFIALPGAIIAAPNLLAAVHPVAVLAMGVLSLGGILKRRGESDPLEAVKKSLQKISEQVEAMHKDMLAGINMLAEQQRQTYIEMMDRFDRLEEILINERFAILRPILINLERAEQRLIVLHQQLSLQMNILHLSGFDELVYEVEETVSSDSIDDNLIEDIKYLKKNKVKQLEHWIEKKLISEHLNGNFFVNFIDSSPVQHAEAYVMNVLMHEGSNEQLPFFIAYLGNRARRLIGDVFGTLNLAKLINPDIWTKGLHAYISMRQMFKVCGITYDTKGKKLKTLRRLGSQYLEFIDILKAKQGILFEKLVGLYQGYVADLHKKALELHAQKNCRSLDLMERSHVKQQITYEKSEKYIRNIIRNKELINPILAQFDKYEAYLNQEVVKMYERWGRNMEKLLKKISGGEVKIEELYDCFDRPSCPFASHRQGTRPGESHLDIHTGPVFIQCEEKGFKIPISLSSLFEHDAALRNAIPKTFYLAEALGVGQFEINVVSQYVNGNHQFVDKEHAVLTKGSFYNHLYKFELSFASMGKRICLCNFQCRADQIPVSEEVLASADLGLKLKNYSARIDSGKHGNEEYWLLMGLGSKNCIFNQVKHLQATSSLTPSNKQEAAFLEKELHLIIKERLHNLREEYYQYFTALEKMPALSRELENIDISRNMILAFMHLLGYDPEQVHQVQNLFSSNTLKLHADLNLSYDTLGDALAKVDEEAMQTLQRIIKDKKLQENLEGYQETDIKLLVEMIDALLLLDGHQLAETATPASKSQINAVRIQKEPRHPPKGEKESSRRLEKCEKIKEGSDPELEKTVSRIAKAIMRHVNSSITLDEKSKLMALGKLKKVLQKLFNQFKKDILTQSQEDIFVLNIYQRIMNDPLFPTQKRIHKFMIKAGIRNFLENL